MEFQPGGKQKKKWQKLVRAQLKTPNFNLPPGVTIVIG